MKVLRKNPIMFWLNIRFKAEFGHVKILVVKVIMMELIRL